MRNSGRVVTRNALMHAAWDSNGDVDDNLIEVYIYLLRKKLRYLRGRDSTTASTMLRVLPVPSLQLRCHCIKTTKTIKPWLQIFFVPIHFGWPYFFV
jgi:hypothetical protein